MKAWLKEAFKSDQTRTREWRDEIVAEQKALRVQFISEAIAVGFTESQAELMAKYMSFEGHQHLYVNTGFNLTQRLERV